MLVSNANAVPGGIRAERFPVRENKGIWKFVKTQGIYIPDSKGKGYCDMCLCFNLNISAKSVSLGNTISHKSCKLAQGKLPTGQGNNTENTGNTPFE